MYCVVFFLDEGILDVAVKSIARTYHWMPSLVMELYYDNIDMYGLFYWYEDAKQYAKDMNAK